MNVFEPDWLAIFATAIIVIFVGAFLATIVAAARVDDDPAFRRNASEGTEEIGDRGVLILFGLGTVGFLIVALSGPSYWLLVAPAITGIAFVMLLRARGRTPLRQTWWALIGSQALSVTLLGFVVADALQHGLTVAHAVIVILSALYAAWLIRTVRPHS